MNNIGKSKKVKVLEEKKEDFDIKLKHYFNYFLLSLTVSLLLSFTNKYIWEMPDFVKLLSISTYIIPAGMLLMYTVTLVLDIFWGHRISEQRELELTNKKSLDPKEDNRGDNKKAEKHIPNLETFELIKEFAIEYGPEWKRKDNLVESKFMTLLYRKHESNLKAHKKNNKDVTFKIKSATLKRRLNDMELRKYWEPSEDEYKKNLRQAQIFETHKKNSNKGEHFSSV